jgi:hypothetical protein
MSRLVMGFSVLDIIRMSGGTMDGVFVEMDGLNIVLVIEMMIKFMMGLMVNDVFSLVLVGRVVVIEFRMVCGIVMNRFPMRALVD